MSSSHLLLYVLPSVAQTGSYTSGHASLHCLIGTQEAEQSPHVSTTHLVFLAHFINMQGFPQYLLQEASLPSALLKHITAIVRTSDRTSILLKSTMITNFFFSIRSSTHLLVASAECLQILLVELI